jgi:hypothetical protein
MSLIYSRIDKFETALANGYSEGQAGTLNRWSQQEVMMFIEDMIRGDGKPNVLVLDDGSQVPARKVAPQIQYDGKNWRKSDYDSGEILPATENQQLAHMCIIKGHVRDGLYEYSISVNKKWLKRKSVC